MGRQLGHFHHALGGDVIEPGGIASAEPAHRQAADMLGQTVASALQHGDAHRDAGFLHLAPQAPAQRHAQRLRRQPHAGRARSPASRWLSTGASITMVTPHSRL